MRQSLWKRIPWWKSIIVSLLIIDVFLLIALSFHSETIEKKEDQNWVLSLTIEGDKCYRQWDSEVAIGPLPAGRVRLEPGTSVAKKWPLLRIEEDRPIQIVKTSELKENYPWKKDHDSIIVYDQFKNLEFLEESLSLLVEDKSSWTIFLDSSGTMAEPLKKGDKQSRYQVALRHLLEKRRVSAQPWNFFTFADGLLDHGQWLQETGIEAFINLPPSGGKTSLGSALNQWLEQEPEVSTIIVISDGEIDQKDQKSIELILKRVRAAGHRISLLSPELKRIPSFDFVVKQGLLLSDWPVLSQAEQVETSYVVTHPEWKWSGLVKTRSGGNAKPVLFSKEGINLVYLEQQAIGLRYHVIGKSAKSLMEIPKALKDRRQQRIVIEFHPKSWLVDLQSNDLRPLMVYNQGFQETIQAKRPGLYEWSKGSAFSDKVAFYHPAIGRFEISQLQGLALLDRTQRKQIEKNWNFSNFFKSIDEEYLKYLYVWVLVHAVIFSLGLWLVYAAPFRRVHSTSS